MKKYLALLCALFSFLPIEAQLLSPKHELRAVWLTTIGGIDWPHSYQEAQQRQELTTILDRLQQAGINTVLVQARVRATTIYRSALEPWDGCLTGTPGRQPKYDALQLVVEECHRRGMECHAWMVTIPVGKWNALGSRKLRQKYPKLIKKIGEEAYMDPEQPLTANYLAQVCAEVVKNYDVDGIHLDYIRYPETWKYKVSRSQGRKYITQIVKEIHDAVKKEKPWVKLSCAPIGKYNDLTRYRSGGWNAYTAVCQDAQAWLRDGLMDALFPMMYFQGQHFYPFAIDWQEHTYGRTVAPGLGIYFLDPKEGKWTLPVIEREMHVLRQLGLGHTYFRSKFFTDNIKGIYDFGCHFDATPALVPPMTWAGTQPPTAPTELVLHQHTLQWNSSQIRSDSPDIFYNIYASADYPVDINNPANIIATRLRETHLLTPHTKLNYAVTATDRYGMESEACQLLLNAGPVYHPVRLSRTDGRCLILPEKTSEQDADFVIIENLMGQLIATRPYQGKLMSLDGIPNGIYQLRTLGRKGRSHRLGFFTIKRPHK